ncbi:stress-induced-phosphoprotein 1-like isoform X2 [Styela clava]
MAENKGIEIDKDNHILYSNRSAAYAKDEKYSEALTDAEKVIELQPKWPKGYSRKGSALQFLTRYDEAKNTFEEGLKIDSNNEQLKKGLKECEDEISRKNFDQSSPIGNPFANISSILPRLRANPKTAKHLSDPTYMAMLKDLEANPKSLTRYLTDPRMTETIGVILGVDIMSPDAFQPPQPNMSTPSESTSKPAEPEQKQESMETEESDEVKKSLEEKALGNSFYKKKEFEKALEHYDKAIELDGTNITFYTNKAAVYFEQGDYDKCRETCFKAVDVGRDHRADYKLVAKAFARIGTSHMKEKNFSEAIKYLNKSLTEHRTKDTLEKLQACQKAVKEAERLAYINPDLSLEEKTKGNEAFQKGKFPDAVKFYTEAVKRNPDDAKLYSNRAAAYMKLMEFSLALKDSEECIKKDPTFVKGHIRKGAALEAMKETTKAMDAYQKATDLDPNAKEASEGYIRCLNNDMQTRHDPESVRRRAMADPEVQEIMSDPAMKMILDQMQNDPTAASEHLKNPEIRKRIQKLMDVGLLTIR